MREQGSFTETFEENRCIWSDLLTPQAGGDCFPLTPSFSCLPVTSFWYSLSMPSSYLLFTVMI